MLPYAVAKREDARAPALFARNKEPLMSFNWSRVGLSLPMLLAVVTGCSTSATITPRFGSPFDAKIVSGDREFVYVEGPGGPQTIPRSDIADIDHPGNVAAVIGGVVGAYGVANIAVGAPECEKQGPAFCVGVFTPAAVGLSVMIWGIATYVGSVSSLSEGERKGQQGQFFVLPTDQFAGQPNTPGITVGSTF